MCLTIHSGPHIAEKDIPVFKVIWKTNKSHYNDFMYQPNKTYGRIDVKPDPWRTRSIEAGFHAFRYGHVHWGVPEDHITLHCIRTNASEPVALSVVNYIYNNSKLVAFTIPKGATYYIGKSGDIVASNIISGSLKPMRSRDLKRKRKVNV